MPRRCAVDTLPAEVKEWLDRALVDQGFAGYRALAAELGERGYEISRSAVHRYGQKFEERLASLRMVTEQARAVVESAPDDDNLINDALMRLVQEKLFSVLQDLEVDPAKINLSSLAKSIAELGRASVTQKKWMAEARELARREAAEATVQVARQSGMSDEAIAQIRELMGVES